MISDGQIVLFPFPQTDQEAGKLRPALILRRCPGSHDDWLICMISSQLRHTSPNMDEVVREGDADFAASGLKLTSVIRTTRLAIVSGDLLQGSIGTLGVERLQRIRRNLARWIVNDASPSSG